MKIQLKRCLITGVSGFTGRHLVARLRQATGCEIIGLDLPQAAGAAVDRYISCDLTDFDQVRRAVRQARPDMVFHLAGLYGGGRPEQIRRVNVAGFDHLRDSLLAGARPADQPLRVLLIGSAAEIGTVATHQLPVPEEILCVPETPYGLSKLEVTRRALSEPVDGPVQFVVARPFNLVGPGLDRRLALGNMAHQVARAKKGQCDVVHCGPLDSRRDFVDVRDAVEAYIALARFGRAGQIYNVCAGRSYRIGDLLRTLIEMAGAPVAIRVDGSGRGAPGVSDIYGDQSKILRELGWRPAVPIEQSLADLLAAA